jgi:hypothetical protein
MKSFAAALLLCSALSSAQNAVQHAGSVPVPANDMTQVFATLSDQPATHTGVTFDRSMMRLAQNILEQNGLDERGAAAAITGVSYDMYTYQRPAFYTPEAMSALLNRYKVAGWKHLVNANQTAANTAEPDHMITDLWLHFSGADIDALTVLARGPKTMNVVRFTGDLRPLDLLHLSGHFGIPKVDPNAVMVPDRN